jgi:hypothetical protein
LISKNANPRCHRPGIQCSAACGRWPSGEPARVTCPRGQYRLRTPPARPFPQLVSLRRRFRNTHRGLVHRVVDGGVQSCFGRSAPKKSSRRRRRSQRLRCRSLQPCPSPHPTSAWCLLDRPAPHGSADASRQHRSARGSCGGEACPGRECHPITAARFYAPTHTSRVDLPVRSIEVCASATLQRIWSALRPGRLRQLPRASAPPRSVLQKSLAAVLLTTIARPEEKRG